MVRGERLGGASAQAAIEADSAGGTGAGIWTDAALRGRDRPPGQAAVEIDPYVYSRFSVAQDLGVIPEVRAYTYAGPVEGGGSGPGYHRTRFEPDVSADWHVAGIVVVPKVAYDLELDGVDAEVSGIYALPLASLGTELDLKATGGIFHDSNRLDGSPSGSGATGGYWLAGVALPMQLGPRARATIGWACTRGSGAPLSAGRGVVTLCLAWKF